MLVELNTICPLRISGAGTRAGDEISVGLSWREGECSKYSFV